MAERRVGAYRRLFRGETSFDFAGRWRRWFAISGTVIVIGLLSLGVRGLNFSIDFKGGTQWTVPTTASVSDARNAVGSVSSALRQATITQLTNRQNGQREISVKAAAKDTQNDTEVAAVQASLAKMAHVPVSAVTLDDVGPSWGSDITDKAVKAVIIFLIAFSIYIWLRFEGKMALAALTALLHDILVTAGIYSLSGFQVSPDTVVAFLTILGYSLYDTIVVFDKIQENTKGLASAGRITYTDTVNLSMNQVLARSLNTSLVGVIPILSILVIGDGVLGATALEDFGLALLIGLVTGAYSSIFVASPIVALLKEREPRYAQIRDRLTKRTGGLAAPMSPAEAAAAGQLGGAATAPRPSRARPTGRAVDRLRGSGVSPVGGTEGNDAAVGDERRRGAEPADPAPAAGNGGSGNGGGSPLAATDRQGADATPSSSAEPSPSSERRVVPVPPRSNRPPPRPRKKRRR